MTNKISSNSVYSNSPEKSKKFYIYRITNVLNGKTYIGQHSYFENKRNDNYMGSGIALKKAFEKYGIENFKKEILIENILSKQDADNLERYLIQEERNLKGIKNVYNEADGGQGGNLGEAVNKKISEKALELWKNNEERKKELSKKFKGVSYKELYGPDYVNSFYGKHHTEESKQKIREAKLGKPLGQWTEEHREHMYRSIRAKRELYLKKKEEGSYIGSWNDFQKEYNMKKNPSVKIELGLV